MTNVRKTFGQQPRTALDYINAAAQRASATRTDIVNWCLCVIGDMHRPNSLYWVTGRGANGKYAKVLLPPVEAGAGQLIVNLLPRANEALLRATRVFGCDEDRLMARAAQLAQYYGREHEGHLATGNVHESRIGSVGMLTYLT